MEPCQFRFARVGVEGRGYTFSKEFQRSEKMIAIEVEFKIPVESSER